MGVMSRGGVVILLASTVVLAGLALVDGLRQAAMVLALESVSCSGLTVIRAGLRAGHADAGL